MVASVWSSSCWTICSCCNNDNNKPYVALEMLESFYRLGVVFCMLISYLVVNQRIQVGWKSNLGAICD